MIQGKHVRCDEQNGKQGFILLLSATAHKGGGADYLSI